MSELSIAFSLFRRDIRWRFVQALYVGGIGVASLMFWFSHPARDWLFLGMELIVSQMVAHLIGITRVGFPFQLGLPVKTSTMLLTTLLLTFTAIWIPAILFSAILIAERHYLLVRLPIAYLALWTLGFCFLRIGWPRRQSAPGFVRAVLCLVQIAIGFRWVLRAPSLVATATLIVASAIAYAVAFTRLPAAFLADSEERGSFTSSPAGKAPHGNVYLTLFRILFPPFTICFILLQAIQNGNWPLQGFWICLLYIMIRAGDPLLLSLPVSQLQLVYARLAFAFVAAVPGCDLFGRLVKSHPGPRPTTSLLSLVVGLALVASIKLLIWRRLQRWSKPMLLIPGGLAAGTFALTFADTLRDRIACLPPLILIPAAIVAIVLLLRLITAETNNSDEFGMGVTSVTSPFDVLNRA